MNGTSEASVVSPAQTDNLAPLWIRISSIFLIVIGIIGIVIYLSQMILTAFFLIGAPGGYLLTIFGVQLLNMAPVVMYLISGFGLRYLRLWSLKLLIVAEVILLLRVGLRIYAGTVSLSNPIEPALLLILLIACYKRKELFV